MVSILKSLSIKGRLIALGTLTAAGFASLVFVGWYNGSETIRTVDQAAAYSSKLQTISEMRLANIELVLAAMDSIIDKAEGQIQPERLQIITTSIEKIRSNQEATVEMAKSLGHPELTNTIVSDLAEVEQAIAVDLPELIARNASEDEFAALDDAIDGGGERINSSLADLAQLANDELANHLATVRGTAESASNWLIVIAASFLVVIGLAMSLTARYINNGLARFGRDMEAIANGELDSQIEAENRSDEIGKMARSLVFFRSAAIEKLAVEADASNARQLSENERRMREEAKAEQDHQIKTAVEEIGQALSHLSEGDLSIHLARPFGEGLETLRHDFNNAVDRLAATMAELREETHEIQSGASQMRSATDDLARRTENQAAALEQISAAVEEITSTVNNASSRADEATKIATQAQSSTIDSRTVVSNAVEAMSRIETASSEIAKITNVIDEIAFQTNLLALNAGVEAARAGEAGRGFAVVAQEVRELAQRSASAAMEIKQLIDKSGKEVADGVNLVNQTGKALGSISELVSTINDHIHSIAASAREQTTGLSEINSAVSQTDQVTQQNAAMVEEATALMHSLTGSTQTLSGLVSQFKIDGQSYQAAQSAPAGKKVA